MSPAGRAPELAVLAVALDLGTTRIKLARLLDDGTLSGLCSVPAPEPAGQGEVREVDPERYARAAESLLEGASYGDAPSLRLGIASQRSSFLLWKRADGVPATPLISWQDRRAAAWCERHRAIEPEVRRIAGLPLSPHYAGPKLAALLERDPSLARRLESGELLFGTLETWLAWRWSGGAAHQTDLTMAARTLFADPDSGDWSDRLLGHFGVPRAALPEIAPTRGRAIPLARGLVLSASIADQPSGLLSVLGTGERAALVNFGTGAFVLRPTGTRRDAAGYLSGPILGEPDRPSPFALEGTVNGGGATADRFAPGPTPIPAMDPSPDAFCLPDENGVGAPHWLPRQPFALSPAAERLEPIDRRRIVLEGLVFRARGILDDIGRDPPLDRLLLSGGLAHDPFLAPALAASLGQPIEVVAERESTLLGAARLAAGLEPCAHPAARTAEPPVELAWLREKYEPWRRWLEDLIGDQPKN